MRSPLLCAICAALVPACAADEPTGPDTPQFLDAVWAQTIRNGDLVVLVPGTGSYDMLGAVIDPLAGDEPVVDVRAIESVANDSIVFEQAIAAAHRAGISDADLEGGALTLGLWGAGFQRVKAFTYVSYEGLHVRIDVIGGNNTCSTGLVAVNLLNYTTDNAGKDSNDLYVKTQAWLASHQSATGSARNVVIASHSWGGAVAEYLGYHLSDIEAAHGPLADSGGVAPIAFTIAAGVPGFVPGFKFAGPGTKVFAEGPLYEVDRPDDPVHAMNPSGNPDGHQYTILYGDTFQGSYGITTEDVSCKGVPGLCGAPPH